MIAKRLLYAGSRKTLGKGDMVFYHQIKPVRIHIIAENEVII
jgi:hypothetical protein